MPPDDPRERAGRTLPRTLASLAALARIRGEATEAALLAQAESLVRARQIMTDGELGALIGNPPNDLDPGVLRPLQHMFDAGAWVIMESAIADLPADLRWLYESGAVTVEQLVLLHERLGVTALIDLATAVEAHAVQSVEGLDERIETAIGAALADLRRSIPRIPLGRAVALVDPILSTLGSLPAVQWALPAGSLRRGLDTVGDIEVVAASAEPASAIDTIAQLPVIDRILHKGPRRLYVLTNRTQVGVRLPEPANAGSTLLHMTGSAGHLQALRARASEWGWHLGPEGLRTSDGGVDRPAATEEEIYDILRLPFIPPEIRNGENEIALAARGELPPLLRREDIRGDLHMHSTWSDGRDSIEAMVTACRALGYEYIAITDHSPRSGASRTLTVQTVRKQAEEIAALRQQFPEITILHGCEVDILPDAKLDFPDRILGEFDIVLASLHQGAGHSPDQLLRRYLTAMKHPLVTLITHPTNRLVPHRAGYDLNYDKLFEAAVESGTVLEIDGAPAHLDMNGPLARRAVAAGVTVAVDSDCHRADMLNRQMQLGLLTARSGWVERRHVLNTRPLADVRALIARKRSGAK